MKRHIGTKLVVGCIAVLVLMLAAGTGVVSGEVAAGDSAGADLFLAAKCNMCHGVASADIIAKTKSEKMLGPDLGGITKDQDADWISKYVRKQVQKDDKDHKKEYKGTEEDLAAMIKWLGQQAAAPE